MGAELQGRVALVTGASRGIGRAVAVALAREGADVAVNYRSRSADAERVRAEVEALGRQAIAVRADVSKSEEVAGLVREVEGALGRISILVNNAGIAQKRSLDELTEADWDHTLEVNLKSVFLVTRAVLSGMRAQGWGRIVNVSSGAVVLGGIIGPHYTASKAGVIGLTRAYASQLTREGILVNAVVPALIETEMIAGNPGAKPEAIPVGRLGTPEEVAEAVAMLVRNGYMSGQSVHLNGGLYMT